MRQVIMSVEFGRFRMPGRVGNGRSLKEQGRLGTFKAFPSSGSIVYREKECESADLRKSSRYVAL